jgi:hypothetical protein
VKTDNTPQPRDRQPTLLEIATVVAFFALAFAAYVVTP